MAEFDSAVKPGKTLRDSLSLLFQNSGIDGLFQGM